MRTKTKYRRQAFRDGGRVEDELKVPVDAAPEVPPVPADQPEPPAPAQRQDDATLALKAQIESLRQSEHARQQAAAMPQEPMTREARLAQWQSQGLSPAELQFLQRNPTMLDHPQLLNFAVHRANEGHQHGTDAHFAAVKQIFNASLAHAQGQAAEPTPMQATPQFFKAPAPRPAPNPASRYSAPVSRDIPSSGSGKRTTPGKITLSASEVEAAKISGLTLEQYAKEKIEYERQREAGEYRDQR